MRKFKEPIQGDNSLLTGLKAKSRKRRVALSRMAASDSISSRNDLLPDLELTHHDPRRLTLPDRNVRKLDPAHISAVMHAISSAGFIDPILIDDALAVLDGVTRVEAARRLGLPYVPCIVAKHLTPTQKRAVRLALNRLSEKGSWSLPDLKAELIELVGAGVVIQDTGFTVVEFDQITLEDDIDPVERGPLAPDDVMIPVARLGDVFVFEGGRHRVVCGDATDQAIYNTLMEGQQACFVPTDVPYNVPIAGHVTKGPHLEFVMASGEMSKQEFLAFNKAWITAAAMHLCDGGLLGTYIDWRGYPTIDVAATDSGLSAINMIVWNKTNAGMGSLYRSQHELFALYKKGTAPHVNNVDLGKNGRWRSNVWVYPGASSLQSDSRKGLVFHPTVKPVAMCMDAILDVTNRDQLVLDPFLGSGSNLIAAQNIGRRCFGIELDPRYVDVVLERYRTMFGQTAVLESTGETFQEVAHRRLQESKNE